MRSVLTVRVLRFHGLRAERGFSNHTFFSFFGSVKAATLLKPSWRLLLRLRLCAQVKSSSQRSRCAGLVSTRLVRRRESGEGTGKGLLCVHFPSVANSCWDRKALATTPLRNWDRFLARAAKGRLLPESWRKKRFRMPRNMVFTETEKFFILGTRAYRNYLHVDQLPEMAVFWITLSGVRKSPALMLRSPPS